MASAVPRRAAALTAQQRASVVNGIASMTTVLTPERVAALVRDGTSLYDEYLTAVERFGVQRLLRQNSDLYLHMAADDALALVVAGRSDLRAVLEERAGRTWFATQWHRLRGIIDTE